MKNKNPHIGMDQLSYFVKMMKYYLDPNQSAHFWNKIREYCPDLMQAFDTFGQPEPFAVMRKVTFTWDLHSPAFAPHLVEAADLEPVGTGEEAKTMNPYTRRVKRGAALLDEKVPGWRDKIILSTLDFSRGGILGQLFDGYKKGVRALFYIDMDDYDVGEWLDSLEHLTVVDHGFTIDTLRVEDDATEWQALRSAWIVELNGSAPQQREQLPVQLEPEQESRI